jgi:hypothetical protein
MTREQIIDHVRSLLSASARESSDRPRPEGTFLGNASRRGTAAVAEIAQSRGGSFFIEGARQAEGFQFGREDVEAACEFMVHLGLLAREPDGSYIARGEDIAARAMDAMDALPQS